MHLRLVDLERGLQRLPAPEYEALNLLGLHDLTGDAAASDLGVSRKTVYNRYNRGIDWLTKFLNGAEDGPVRRTLTGALDDDPLFALRACVNRHRTLFEPLDQRVKTDADLAGLQVAWAKQANSCVPLITEEARSQAERAGGRPRPLAELLPESD
jgi:hypothetical protein